MISRYGISSVTMDMIAKNCGISKRTLYECFSDKTSLVCTVLAFYNDKYEWEINEIVKHSENALIAMLDSHKLVVKNLSKISQSFFIDMHRLYPQASSMFEEMGKRQRQHIISLIEQGKNEGMFRKDVNTEIIAYVNSFRNDKQPFDCVDERFSPAEIYETFFVCFMRGISTAKGIEIIDKYLETGQ